MEGVISYLELSIEGVILAAVKFMFCGFDFVSVFKI